MLLGVDHLGQGEATWVRESPPCLQVLVVPWDKEGLAVSWVLAPFPYSEISCFLLLLCLLAHPAGSRKKQETVPGCPPGWREEA